ncbi:MAG: hypothetical protein P4M13_03485 [Alphaproteobacteria bacterium]|nr:hypothetical protein [Alphaproteobacteria bacterium]
MTAASTARSNRIQPSGLISVSSLFAEGALLLLPDRIVPFPEDEEKLYQALGLALTRWQHAETALYLIAFALMGTDHQSCAMAFFYIKSAENKLAFVDRLLTVRLSQFVIQRYWKPIVKDTRTVIDVRNALAHYETVILNDEGMKKLKPKTNYRYILANHHLDFYQWRNDTGNALSVEKIIEHSDNTKLVTYKMLYFLIDHVPWPEQQAASLEPRLLQWFDSFRRGSRPPGFEPPQKSSHQKRKKLES